MRVTVWVDEWQMQCCGAPFAVDSDVTWTVTDAVEREWLEIVIDAKTAKTIDFVQDHHEVMGGEETELSGRVRAVSVSSCSYAPSPDEKRAIVPVPGTGVLRAVDRADGRASDTKDQRFNGYVVELEVGPKA
jgi:hypothetical protein